VEDEMKNRQKTFLAAASVFGLALFLLASFHSVAQDKPKREEFHKACRSSGAEYSSMITVTLNVCPICVP
jgi:hypothetical protein